MDQNVLEQMHEQQQIAATSVDGPTKQQARINFYNMCWQNWDLLYAALKEQPVGN